MGPDHVTDGRTGPTMMAYERVREEVGYREAPAYKEREINYNLLHWLTFLLQIGNFDRLPGEE